MSRLLFGIMLALVGLLYIWLAYQAVAPDIRANDWVGYLGALLFLLAAVGAAIAGAHLVRAKRR